jgi:hypothetical protein
MCRALLQRPNLTDEEAGSLLDQMYGAAEVCVEAFIEQHGRPAAVMSAGQESGARGGLNAVLGAMRFSKDPLWDAFLLNTIA